MADPPPFRVPATDLAGDFRAIRQDALRAVANVLAGGDYILGRSVGAFEREFAAYCGSRWAVSVANCTDALTIALLAMGIGPGDEVITTPVTFIATVAAIARTGATPVLVDIDPRSLTMDVQATEAAVTPRTRALLPVHLYGHPADMDGLTAIATRVGATVLEDSAQSVGSSYRGRRTGSLGDAAAFSFFPTKNLGCYGDGGAILSSRRDLVTTALQLRQHGFDGEVSVRLGFNSRLDTVQAAVLRVKLRALADQLARRVAVADRYGELLAGTDLVPPSVAEDCVHSYYQYSVLVPTGRDEAVAFLREGGVEVRTYYSAPLHLQRALRHLGYRSGQFPHSEAYAARGMCLPCHPGIGDEQLEYVGTLLRQRFGGGR